MDYGAIIYNLGKPKILEIISQLRIALGAFCTSPINSILCEENESPLAFGRKILSIKYASVLDMSPQNSTYEYTIAPRKYHYFPSWLCVAPKIITDVHEFSKNYTWSFEYRLRKLKITLKST